MICTPKNQDLMSVKEALTEAWSMIKHTNCNYNDKIELFYRITPYNKNKNMLHDVEGGYISWKLASNYCIRSQFFNPSACGSCWHGNPPDKHFLQSVGEEIHYVRMKMMENVRIAKMKSDFVAELDAYRASDEVDEVDTIFLK